MIGSIKRISTVFLGLALSGALDIRVAGAGGLDVLKNTTPSERAKAQTSMMKTKLGLSNAQTSQIAVINDKYAQQMEPVIKGSEGPLVKLREARAIQDKKEAELKAVLSTDQFATFQAAKAAMRDQMLHAIQAEHAKQ